MDIKWYLSFYLLRPGLNLHLLVFQGIFMIFEPVRRTRRFVNKDKMILKFIDPVFCPYSAMLLVL